MSFAMIHFQKSAKKYSYLDEDQNTTGCLGGSIIIIFLLAIGFIIGLNIQKTTSDKQSISTTTHAGHCPCNNK